jgi:hypothetical protein
MAHTHVGPPLNPCSKKSETRPPRRRVLSVQILEPHAKLRVRQCAAGAVLGEDSGDHSRTQGELYGMK